MGAVQRSERKIIRESRDHEGDKITISSVSAGIDGAYQKVKPHFLYSKHRGNGVKDEFFGSFTAAENKFLEKKGDRESIIYL